MSTRSAIARSHGDGWKGRYKHSDGYPTGTGPELIRMYHDVFGADLDAMCAVLLDEHYGWSHFADYQTSDPGEDVHGVGHQHADIRRMMYGDGRFAVVPHVGMAYTTQGGQSDPDEWITCACPNDASRCDPLFIEWAYVLSPNGIGVYVCRRCGEHAWEHVFVGVAAWDATMYIWRGMEQHGDSLREMAYAMYAE